MKGWGWGWGWKGKERKGKERKGKGRLPASLLLQIMGLVVACETMGPHPESLHCLL